MRNTKHRSKSFAGFSLIELAGVLTIIAICTGALLTLANNKINDARVDSTRQKMQVIEKALQAFVKQYGYLPCPARIDITSANANYGWGVASGGVNSGTLAGSCASSGTTAVGGSAYAGMIPFKTISSALDPSITVDSWGNRIVYVVENSYTSITSTSTPNGTAGFGFSNAYSANTSLSILTKASGGNIIEGSGSGLCNGSCQTGICGSGYCDANANNYLPDSRKVAYILVSYGANGYYGYPDRNPTVQNEASANTNEIENNLSNTSFVQRLLDTNFDDIVRYKTRWQLD